jgi:hypothetical protein
MNNGNTINTVQWYRRGEFFFAPIVFCICLCLSCHPDDLPQALLKHADEVVRIEFLQGRDTTMLTETDNGWQVNNGRTAEADRVSAWWQMALNWRMRRMELNESAAQELSNSIKRDGLRATLFTKHTEKYWLQFYIHDIKSVGRVVWTDEKLFLIDRPYAQETGGAAFSAAPGFWNNTTVCAYLPQDIDTIKVEHVQRPDASFVLVLEGEHLQVMDANGAPLRNPQEALMTRYITYFRQVDADTVVGSLPAAEVLAAESHLQHRITICSTKGKSTIAFFGIPLPEGEYDTDKCLLFMVESKEWALGSWVSFDLLLRNLTDFVDKK